MDRLRVASSRGSDGPLFAKRCGMGHVEPNHGATIGEAMSELGYAYLRQFRLRRGLDFCREGVHFLRKAGRPGFLARGLRKLSVAYLSNGRLITFSSTYMYFSLPTRQKIFSLIDFSSIHKEDKKIGYIL